MSTGMISQLVLLLIIANGTPALLGLVLGPRCNQPLDSHYRLWDGHPVLGPSKTLRGLIGALLATALLAPLFQLPIAAGAAFALLAMLGDLASSFIKRRLDIASGRSIPLLDQLPESVLPLWGMQSILGASQQELVAAVIVFMVIDLLLSRVLRSIRA